MWADIATGVERLPYRIGCLPTLKQNSVLYSYSKDTILSAAAHLQLLGWPNSKIPKTRSLCDTNLRGLAGEGYSLPLCTVISFVMYANPYGTWWETE